MATLRSQHTLKAAGEGNAPEDSDNENENEDGERSSSIVSRASNASYSVGDHQLQASHTRGAITASEFNISTGRNPRESWLADDHVQDAQRAYNAHHNYRADSSHNTQTLEPGERRSTRGSDYPTSTPSSQRHHHLEAQRNELAQNQSKETHRQAASVSIHQQQHQQQQQHQTGGTSLHRLTQAEQPGSFSDTGASDKEQQVGLTASGMTAGGAHSGDYRSDRRARVRDQQQQSSNERSIGDGGGSSQSLRSQSGGQTTSGELSKKSNSTTQLSLSGKLRRTNSSGKITGFLSLWLKNCSFSNIPSRSH